MVLTGIVLIGEIILAVIFNKQIADFLREFTHSEQIQEVISSVTEPVTQAGVATGKAVGEAILPINIFIEEKKIEKEAIDLGFTSLAEAEKALDAGSIVIGGTKTIVDVGIIGDVLPSNPSPEFLANPEKFLTPEQLKRFEEQQALGIIKTAPTIIKPPTFPTNPTCLCFTDFTNLFGGQTQPKQMLSKATVTDPTRQTPSRGIIVAQQPDPSLVSPFIKPQKIKSRGELRFGR